MSQLHQDSPDHWRLSGEINFNTVPQLLEDSQPWFVEARSLEVDWSEVEQVNSAGLGLALEWMDWAAQAGIRLNFRHLPADLLSIARITQVDEVLRGITSDPSATTPARPGPLKSLSPPPSAAPVAARKTRKKSRKRG